MSKFNFDSHNHVTARFKHETSDTTPFRKPADVYAEFGAEQLYPVRALYVTHGGEYGPQPILVTDHFKLNAPSHMVRKFNEIMLCRRSVKLIDEGMVSFQLVEYENKYGTQLSIKWIDNEEPIPEPTEE